MMKKVSGLIFLLTLLLVSLSIEAKETKAVMTKIYSYEKAIKPNLEKMLLKRNLTYPLSDLYIRIFKHESELEVWGKNKDSKEFILIKTYKAHNLPYNDIDTTKKDLIKNILSIPIKREISEGEIGPKDRIGDSKVPEGYYHVLYHNPWSSFHLSLALGYPNPADAVRGYNIKRINKKGKENILNWWSKNIKIIRNECISGAPSIWYDKLAKPLGNQIFIHGSFVTIGCIPIGDKMIEEVFVLTNPEYVGGTRVDIFPCKYTKINIGKLKKIGEGHPELIKFWLNLKTGYDHFEKTKNIPDVWVDLKTGEYKYKKGSQENLFKI
ncbi:L,D-transpeptidase family protein [Candidatus Dependentiae bacterium]|nr:L,D-transpeptidase family protein [Candidatus Dependentiae bacterium]